MSKAQVEALKKILKDKEAEISEAKHHLHQAKEDVVQKYRDSNALLKELGGSFADSFDDYFCKVKASFFDLDLSHVSIDAQAQTLASPSTSKEPTSSSPMRPTSTLKVTVMVLMLTKKNSRTLPVT